MQSIDELLRDAPLFYGMTREALELVAGCGSGVRFHEPEILFGAGDPADTFYVIQHGTVTIEMLVPGRGRVTIETLERGDVVGWSWLFPPYRWHFEACARSLVRAIAFDAACIRARCDAEPAFGYDLMSRFTQVLIDRLGRTQLQLLDACSDTG
jgi:CRP/FNR family transcriptional regulator, cyclic AMP receptor protein